MPSFVAPSLPAAIFYFPSNETSVGGKRKRAIGRRMKRTQKRRKEKIENILKL